MMVKKNTRIRNPEEIFTTSPAISADKKYTMQVTISSIINIKKPERM